MMDVQTKEQFLKEYDEHITKIDMGGARNCSKNCWDWYKFLNGTKIAGVRGVVSLLTKYSDWDEYINNFNGIFSVQITTIPPTKEEILRIVISIVEAKHHFFKDFVFLWDVIRNFEEERSELFDPSYNDFLSRFENTSWALREIFVTCLDLPDADPTIDRDEQREIPASDQIVKINHKDPGYKEIMEKLTELEAAISKSNSIENDDKERLQAELKAGEVILQGKTARIEVIKTLLWKCLKHVSICVADDAIVTAAKLLAVLVWQHFGLM